MNTEDYSKLTALLEKINQQVQQIDNRSSLIDIDILLDDVKAFYIACNHLKNTITETEPVSQQGDIYTQSDTNGTLSLFSNGFDEEPANKAPVAKKHTTKPAANPVETTPASEQVSTPKPIIEDKKQETPKVEPKIEPKVETKVETKIETKTEPQQEPLDDFVLDADMLNDVSEAEPEKTASPEENKHSDAFDKGIDLDAIEFAEGSDEYEESDEEEIPAPRASKKNGPDLPPPHWGDETEFDSPIISGMSISEAYKNERPSINDMVRDINTNNTLGVKLKHSNATSLLNLIDTNTRFSLVKGLFKNDNNIFLQEINNLDEKKTLATAIDYLNELKEQFRWKEDSESFKDLKNIILKKFSHSI